MRPTKQPTERQTLVARLTRLLSHDVHPAVQFIKYAAAGGIATAVHITTFFLCGWLLLPCLTADDILVRLLGLTVTTVSETARLWNANLCNAIGFVISNTVCYLLNRLFVFQPGRHHWFKEFLLFIGVSAISLAVGSTIQSLLIVYLTMQTTLAFGANLVSALLINYAMRKFVIFKG